MAYTVEAGSQVAEDQTHWVMAEVGWSSGHLLICPDTCTPTLPTTDPTQRFPVAADCIWKGQPNLGSGRPFPGLSPPWDFAIRVHHTIGKLSARFPLLFAWLLGHELGHATTGAGE